MRAMIMPDATPTGSMRMILTPIATMIVVSHDIGGGNREIGQVPTPLPFQDHERVSKRGLLQHFSQAVERVNPDPIPLGGEMLLTPTGDIVLDLMVGMKFMAVVSRVRFEWQSMHRPRLTIDARFGFLG